MFLVPIRRSGQPELASRRFTGQLVQALFESIWISFGHRRLAHHSSRFRIVHLVIRCTHFGVGHYLIVLKPIQSSKFASFGGVSEDYVYILKGVFGG